MSSQTVARIVDPSISDEDFAWGEEPFVAATDAPPSLVKTEPSDDAWLQPPAEPVVALQADGVHARLDL